MKKIKIYFFIFVLLFILLRFVSYNVENRVKKLEANYDILPINKTSSSARIQDERLSRIRDVCEICEKNRVTEECNHVTMDSDYHLKYMYSNILVDEKHKVNGLYSLYLKIK